MAIALKIEIVSDVVCPWCIIGFKALQQALSNVGEVVDADIHWQPFELNPQMPEAGENLRSHLSQKYGTTLEGSIQARANITQMGAELGFEFNYFDDMRMYNTRKAHKLIHWARDSGLQTELKLELFTAFFSRQQSLADESILLDCVETCGLSRGAAKVILDDPEFDILLQNAEEQWRAKGIQSVPSFIFNDSYLVSGGQGVETFTGIIDKLINE